MRFRRIRSANFAENRPSIEQLGQVNDLPFLLREA